MERTMGNVDDDLTWWWVSTSSFTCAVAVDTDDVIRKTAPILRRFRRQPRANLLTWVQGRYGTNFQMERLPADDARATADVQYYP